MSLKITFIGAGSLVFARTLFTDIMSVPELQKAEISFTDINPDNLETVSYTHLDVYKRQVQTREVTQQYGKTSKQTKNKKRQHIGVSRFDTWKCSYDIPIYLDDKHQF